MADLPDDPISRAFEPLLGLPAWGGMKGQGSMMSFEFGVPHLTIREPYVSQSSSLNVRRNAARRRVRPSGGWFLFICCEWRVLSGHEPVASSESEALDIERAIRELDGQELVSIEVGSSLGHTELRFDLGGVLTTWPVVGENDAQWSLHMPDRQVLSYRADGHYSLGPADQPSESERWQPLPRSPILCALP